MALAKKQVEIQGLENFRFYAHILNKYAKGEEGDVGLAYIL